MFSFNSLTKRLSFIFLIVPLVRIECTYRYMRVVADEDVVSCDDRCAADTYVLW